LRLNLQNNHFVSKLLKNLLTYEDIYVYLKLYIYTYLCIQFYCSYLSHHCITQRHSEKNILLE
jgi:hypothetical protein